MGKRCSDITCCLYLLDLLGDSHKSMTINNLIDLNDLLMIIDAINTRSVDFDLNGDNQCDYLDLFEFSKWWNVIID